MAEEKVLRNDGKIKIVDVAQSKYFNAVVIYRLTQEELPVYQIGFTVSSLNGEALDALDTLLSSISNIKCNLLLDLRLISEATLESIQHAGKLKALKKNSMTEHLAILCKNKIVSQSVSSLLSEKSGKLKTKFISTLEEAFKFFEWKE